MTVWKSSIWASNNIVDNFTVTGDLDVTGDITVAGTITGRQVPRVLSTTSSATPTINTDNCDIYQLTAQAEAITSMTTNLSGTPVEGDVLIIEITGTAARAITWGASFEESIVGLPATTAGTDKLTVCFMYNGVTDKWRCTGWV